MDGGKPENEIKAETKALIRCHVYGKSVMGKMFSTGKIDWVWVDLDDTIWDFSANSLDALGQVYESEHLVEFFPTVDEWRERYLECNHSLWPLYNVGKITKEFLMTERFRRVLVEAGCAEERAVAMSAVLDREYLDRLGRLKRLVPGALELLRHLRRNGYNIGVISNGFYEVQHRKMSSSGIGGMMDAVVLSDDIGVNKPDRRIFDYAVNKVSGSAGRSLIIGDNPDTDIAGGLGAGWHAVYFNRDGMCRQPVPEGCVEIQSLFAAIDLL